MVTNLYVGWRKERIIRAIGVTCRMWCPIKTRGSWQPRLPSRNLQRWTSRKMDVDLSPVIVGQWFPLKYCSYYNLSQPHRIDHHQSLQTQSSVTSDTINVSAPHHHPPTNPPDPWLTAEASLALSRLLPSHVQPSLYKSSDRKIILKGPRRVGKQKKKKIKNVIKV